MPEKIGSGLIHRKIITPFVNQLKQGADARSLANAVAAGLTIAIIPVLGITTGLCFFVGVRWKLNQPILQLVNYLFYPVQILLFPLFLLAGSKLMGVPPVTLSPSALVDEFKVDPLVFLSNYGMAGARALIVWLLLAVPLFYLVRLVSEFLLSKWIQKQGVKS